MERLFLTIRQQLLAGSKATTLDELNAELARFLAAYHQRPHRSLECSPLQKRLSVNTVCRKLPEVADIQLLFAATRICRVYADGTIRLNRRRLEVPGCLPGSRVRVHYLPWDPNWVYYGDSLAPARAVDTAAAARRFNHPKGGLS